MATGRLKQSFRSNQVRPLNTAVETSTPSENWLLGSLRCDKMCCCNTKSTQERQERQATSGPLQQVLKIVFISSIPCLLLFVSEGLDITNRQKVSSSCVFISHLSSLCSQLLVYLIAIRIKMQPLKSSHSITRNN